MACPGCNTPWQFLIPWVQRRTLKATSRGFFCRTFSLCCPLLLISPHFLACKNNQHASCDGLEFLLIFIHRHCVYVYRAPQWKTSLQLQQQQQQHQRQRFPTCIYRSIISIVLPTLHKHYRVMMTKRASTCKRQLQKTSTKHTSEGNIILPLQWLHQASSQHCQKRIQKTNSSFDPCSEKAAVCR
jgi:hypothetical protein